jgi:hypothetical protein
MELRAEGEGDKMVVVSAKTSGYIGGRFVLGALLTFQASVYTFLSV